MSRATVLTPTWTPALWVPTPDPSYKSDPEATNWTARNIWFGGEHAPAKLKEPIP